VTREDYRGRDHVHTTNGSGMQLRHVGQSSLPTSKSTTLALNQVLHVPSVTYNLLSLHRLTKDNNVFCEIYTWYFLVKDRHTRDTLLRDRCRGGLYSLDDSPIKQVFSSLRTSHDQWHCRLGHPV
jgi:hypothetical protein